jgi:hypothetical protein
LDTIALQVIDFSPLLQCCHKRYQYREGGAVAAAAGFDEGRREAFEFSFSGIAAHFGFRRQRRQVTSYLLPQLSRILFPLLRLLPTRSPRGYQLKAQKTSQSHGKWIMAVNETISYSIH